MTQWYLQRQNERAQIQSTHKISPSQLNMNFYRCNEIEMSKIIDVICWCDIFSSYGHMIARTSTFHTKTTKYTLRWWFFLHCWIKKKNQHFHFESKYTDTQEKTTCRWVCMLGDYLIDEPLYLSICISVLLKYVVIETQYINHTTHNGLFYHTATACHSIQYDFVILCLFFSFLFLCVFFFTFVAVCFPFRPILLASYLLLSFWFLSLFCLLSIKVAFLSTSLLLVSYGSFVYSRRYGVFFLSLFLWSSFLVYICISYVLMFCFFLCFVRS